MRCGLCANHLHQVEEILVGQVQQESAPCAGALAERLEVGGGYQGDDPGRDDAAQRRLKRIQPGGGRRWWGGHRLEAGGHEQPPAE